MLSPDFCRKVDDGNSMGQPFLLTNGFKNNNSCVIFFNGSNIKKIYLDYLVMEFESPEFIFRNMIFTNPIHLDQKFYRCSINLERILLGYFLGYDN